MKNRLKQLGKDSIIYGFGGVIAKGIGFLLLPIYTRVFSPADYGIITMLTVLTSFLGALLVMGMDSAQSFYFFEQKEGGRPAQAQVITAVLQWRLMWGMAIVGASLLLSPLLNTVFFDGQLAWEYFAVAFVGGLFGQFAGQSSNVFRLLYRPWSYLGITLSSTLLSAATTITLVIWFDWGILGFIVGSGVGSVVAAIIGWWAIRDYLDWSVWHRDWWPRLLHFGAPLMPAALIMYALNTADRWFINFYHDQEVLGLYAVGAKFTMLMALAVTGYRTAWWPIAMDAMHSADGPMLFRTVGRLYLGLGSAGIVLLTAFSPWLVQIFTAPAYHVAYPIIGVLAWQSLFYGFYLIAAAGIWKKEKTAWTPIGMGIAALLNVALNAWLVPQFGGLGAAVATSISFFIWNVLTLWISEKLWPVHNPFGIFGLQVGLGIAATIGILVLYSQDQALWKIVVVTTMAIVCLVGLSIERKHLAALNKYGVA